MKAKRFLSAVLAATLGFGSAFAAAGPKHAASPGVKATAEDTETEYVDVTDLYATNCGFDIASDFQTSNISSGTAKAPTGWPSGVAGSWCSSAVFEIGSSYTCNGATVPTTNASNEKSGGVLGLTAAWKGSIQCTQAVVLPVGSYEIEVAVYATQGKSFSNNLFGYVEQSGTEHYGTTKTFTKGTWTKEKVSFTLKASNNGKISVGFTGVDKGSGDNEKLFVDYVKIYQDKTSADTYFQGLVTTAQANAKTALESAATSDEATALKALAEQEMPSTYKEMIALAKNINTGIAGLSVAPNVAKIKSLLQTYTTNVTDKLSTTGTGNMGTTTGQHWSGNTSTTYYDSWSSSATDVQMTFNEVTLPVGKYALFATGRSNTTDPGYLSVKVGDNDAVTANFANNNSVGLGVDTDGNPNASYNGTYANNGNGYGWQWSAVEFEVTDATQKVVVSFGASLNSTWVSVCDFKLYAQEVDTKEVLAELTAAKTAAQATLDAVKAYYTDSEYTALDNLLKQDAPTSYDDIVARTAEIKTAEAALKSASIPSYIASLKKDCIFDVSAKLGTSTGNMVTNTGGQHWSGKSGVGYWEQTSAQWGSTAWETSMTFPEVTLPAGTYALLATGRGSASTVSYIRVKVADADETTYEVNFPTKGDTGYGVDTDGHATISADSTYCNNGAGRGWEYRAIPFTLTEEQKVTISMGGSSDAQYQWISISDLQLLSDQDIYQADNLEAFKKDIELTNAYLETIYDINEEDKSLTYSYDCIDENNDVAKAMEILFEYSENNSKNSNEIIADHTKYLSLLKAGVKAAFENAELQAPQASEKFNVIINGNNGYNYNGKTLTAKYNASTSGNYSLGYTEDQGSYYSQAVTLEAVEGKTNTFAMSFTGADGTKLYVGTGTNYGGNNNQLRVVTDQSKALGIKVEVDLDNIFSTAPFRLVNTATNTYISANSETDQGFYTSNKDWKNFQIVEAAKNVCSLYITDAQWATFIAPFDAEVPNDVTAYSCSSADTDNNLVLVKAETLKANTPYILHCEKATAETTVYSNLSGYACATADTYTIGALTGTFKKIESVAKNANNYVLQQQTIDGEAVVAFFLVQDDNVWCNANRAYLTMEGANGAAAFHFVDNKVDGIHNAALNGNATEVARYNAAGLRIAAPVKGVNIVKYSDGRVVKQIVK